MVDKLVLQEWGFCGWVGNPPKENKVIISKDEQSWISADQMTKHLSTTNLEEEETVDAPGNDGIASMPEQVKRPNRWRKTMTMIIPATYFGPLSIVHTICSKICLKMALQLGRNT